MPDGSVVRSGTNYSGKFQEAHDASKASIQSKISNLEIRVRGIVEFLLGTVRERLQMKNMKH
ncbi:hypothetical protein QMA40_16190 [Bacillus thuringiensis]